MPCLKNLRTDLNADADTGGVWTWNLSTPITVTITGLGSVTLSQGQVIDPGNDDPELDFDTVNLSPGTYTNAFKYAGGTGTCASEAFVDLVKNAPPNAGLDNTVNLCNNDAPRTLINDLNGTPENDGTWANDDSDAGYNAGGAGPLDDTFDPAGAARTVHFTYTVTDTSADCPCPDATATITYVISESFDPGSGGTVEVCG